MGNDSIVGYHIQKKLYESSRSLVYRGYDERIEQSAILKILKDESPSSEKRARFQREYFITQKLGGNGVVEVFSLEKHQNTLVLILEDFGGESLDHILKNREFDLNTYIQLAIRIAEILGHIHQTRIIHKDINPSNIVWNPVTKQLKLIDFGISSELPRETSQFVNVNNLEGTLAYLSPEQTGRMNRSLDYRTDLYSLGVTLYEMVTGRRPFETHDVLEMIHCHLAQMPVPPGDLVGAQGTVPLPLSDIIMKLLAKNAEDRYQSVFGLKSDLERCVEQLNSVNSSTSTLFPLGQHDMIETLQIPEKLYGREEEISTLLHAFERVSSGQKEILFIAGHSGVGKSALAQEIHRPITEKQGDFLSGKFDQLQRNIPYSAFIQAFQSRIHRILQEPESRIAFWKETLLQSLGDNAQLIIDVIPQLELILEEQPAIPELPPVQAQHCFNLVFQSFVQSFATAEHPLVIFLDDLQWADSASLIFIELLMTAPKTKYFLLIGTYRDNEVSDAHPLMRKIDDMRESVIPIATVTLEALKPLHVGQLLAETLQTSSHTIQQFSRLLYQKTSGNPFFLTQFLYTLYEEKLLQFNWQRQEWIWNIEKIQHKASTDNVITLMAERIQKLPEATRNVVQLAACIGNRFDLATLSFVYERSSAGILHDLWEALQTGIIFVSTGHLPVGSGQLPVSSYEEIPNTEFQFLHDRVQQAAYSLVDEAQKTSLHLKIGRLLLSRLSQEEQEERIFEIINHLNTGRDDISEQAEKDTLAELNLAAGRKAKESAAHNAAYTYFKTGFELLGKESWQHQYTMTLALHLATAETAYLNGEFGETDNLVDHALANSRTALDSVSAYEVKIEAHKAQNNLPAAIDTALSALDLLGIHLPAQPTFLHIMYHVLSINWLLRGKQIGNLVQLPVMTDPVKHAAIRILSRMGPAAYFSRPQLLIVSNLTSIRLSLQYGNTPASSYFYASYGVIFCEFPRQIERGYQFGQLALKLLTHLPDGMFKVGTLAVVHGFITHWKTHAKNALPALLEAYQSGLETGDLEYAALSADLYTQHLYFTGKNLRELEQDMAAYSEVMRAFKQHTALNFQRIKWQTVLNLQGKGTYPSQPWRLVGETYHEEQMLLIHRQADDRTAIFQVYFSKLVLCYLFESYQEARQYATIATQYRIAVRGTFYIPLFNFYDSLALLAVLSDAAPVERWRCLRHVAKNQQIMKGWAAHAPMNFLHKFYLVEAERMKVRRKDAKAMLLYDKAIQLAATNEYLQEEALANELAAKFYLARGQEKVAKTYMRDARYCYHRWGATAKVRQIDRAYPALVGYSQHERGVSHDSQKPHFLGGTTTSATTSNILDLAAIMKASHTLTGEVDLEQLLQKLIRLVMQQAGAQKAFLLLEKDEKWYIEAQGGNEQKEACLSSTLLQWEDMDQKPTVLPKTLLRYVIRAHETVVLNNASEQGDFRQDAYIKTHQPKSILCLPLLNQNHLDGILYLENNLNTGTFTAKSIHVLQILATQAAISIKNARLYDTLEQQVQERTQALEQEVGEREQAEKSASEANQAKSEFLASMSHELRSPLNAILGYAQILHREAHLNDKQRKAVDVIQRSGEHLLMVISDVLDLSKIEARKINITLADFNLQRCLGSVADMARMRARQKEIGFTTEFDVNLPNYVHGDEKCLRQVLLNLLNNAVKFTPEGEVVLKVSRRQKAEGGGQKAESRKQEAESRRQRAEGRKQKMERVVLSEVEGKQVEYINEESNTADSLPPTADLCFEVQDTGIGIPADHLERIFLPFHQVQNPAIQHNGTGLGLAISQRLIHLMGGELHVTSAPGQGSTFSFELEFANATTTTLQEGERSQQIVGYHGKSRTIMIVDDQTENRNILKDTLLPLGFDILEAVNGKDALRQLHAQAPDLLLIDLMMPELNGFETIRRIRQQSRFQALPIISISAHVLSNIQQDSLQAGGQDFLAKPISFETLFEKLQRYLALEWIYDETTEEQPLAHSGLPTPSSDLLLAPSAEILEVLFQWAMRGDVHRLKEQARELEHSNPSLRPFGEQLYHMATAYQIDEIQDFLTQYMEEHS